MSHSPRPATAESPSLPNGQNTPLVESETNLDEVAAPPPVEGQSEKPIRHERYLENQRSREDAQNEATTGEERQTRDPELQLSEIESHQKPKTKHGHSELIRTVYIISYLILFSFMGTLLRMAIESLTFYPGTPVNTSVLWANVGGSLIMGFLSEDQELFRFKEVDAAIDDDAQRKAHLKAHKKTIPLFIGLTTGFCGSLTSFSTFMRDLFLALAGDLAVPFGSISDVSLFGSSPAGASAPNGGYDFMAIIAVLFTEVGLSLVGLMLGAHIAILLKPWTPCLPKRLLEKFINPLTVLVAVLSWIALICLVILLPRYGQDNKTLWSSELWRGPIIFSLVFAPAGTLTRSFLSLNLNGRIVGFPLGTFAANIGGTMILGMAYSLQRAPISPSSLGGGNFVGCQVLEGIMDGFCGCLTTVSTWVLELVDLRRRHAYVYGFASVAAGLCMLIVEVGSLKWTRGFVTPACFQ